MAEKNGSARKASRKTAPPGGDKSLKLLLELGKPSLEKLPQKGMGLAHFVAISHATEALASDLAEAGGKSTLVLDRAMALIAEIGRLAREGDAPARQKLARLSKSAFHAAPHTATFAAFFGALHTLAPQAGAATDIASFQRKAFDEGVRRRSLELRAAAQMHVEKLLAIARAWLLRRPGAKAASGRSKWSLLARLLSELLGEDVTPGELEKAHRAHLWLTSITDSL